MSTAKVNPYIGFDDRWFIIIGIISFGLATSVLFYGCTWERFISYPHLVILEPSFFTSAFWLTFRQILIWGRKTWPSPSDVKKRIGITVLICFALAPLIGMGLDAFVNKVKDNFMSSPLSADEEDTRVLATYFNTLFILSIYEAGFFFTNYHKEVVEKERIKSAHLDSQLINLRNQVNPHFLFNSLNTLMNLIPEKEERAQNFLTKLSRFYRHTVSEPEGYHVSVQQDMEVLDLYLDILQERFQDGLIVEKDIGVPTSAVIPPMTMQLLVENAIKHNVVSALEPLHIRIFSDDTHIEICNTLQPRITTTAGTGIGLKNIRARFSYLSDEPIVVAQDTAHYRVRLPIIQVQT